MSVIITNCDYKEEEDKISNLQYTETDSSTGNCVCVCVCVCFFALCALNVNDDMEDDLL